MPVTITNAEALEALTDIREVLVKQKDTLPVKPNYWLRRMMAPLARHIEDAVEPMRKSLLENHAKKGENGQMIEEGDGQFRRVVFATPEDAQAFSSDYSEILRETWEFPLAVKLATFDGVVGLGAAVLLMEDSDATG